jgi:hypothetical protein
VGGYACTALSCGTVLATLLATVTTRIASIAPTGCSVNAEVTSPERAERRHRRLMEMDVSQRPASGGERIGSAPYGIKFEAPTG